MWSHRPEPARRRSDAVTASNALPASTTAGYGQTRVVGAMLVSLEYTYGTDGRATGFTAELSGDLLLKTVSASYDGGSALTCTTASLLTSLLNTTVTCTGTAPRPAMPSVTVTVS